MLNFGDFSRYGRTLRPVKKGNFWGLPVNFVFFSLLTVLTAAATLPVYGELITDPVETVGQIDNTFALVLAALTFTTATIGINIVANFVSPAFDFSNVCPQKICWRIGGMIAAVGSVLLTPWNLYNSPETIHYTLDTLGAFIGPLFGVLIATTTSSTSSRSASTTCSRWTSPAPTTTSAATTRPPSGPPRSRRPAPLSAVFVPGINRFDDYSWFIGCGVGFVAYCAAGPADGRQRQPRSTRRRACRVTVHLTVVNPNTTASMTALIEAEARRVAGPGTVVKALTPSMGPASIESHYDEALAVPGLLEIIRGDQQADAFVLACFGDPGLDAAREAASGPVIGIAEAAMKTARCWAAASRSSPPWAGPSAGRGTSPAPTAWSASAPGCTPATSPCSSSRRTATARMP